MERMRRGMGRSRRRRRGGTMSLGFDKVTNVIGFGLVVGGYGFMGGGVVV